MRQVASRRPLPRRWTGQYSQSVAAELGISRSTVSNAYSRPDQLSAELRARILATAERPPRAGIYNGQVEAEICLTAGRRLSGERVTRDEAYAAVESVAPAFEINARRLSNKLPLACRIGNGLNNWGLVVGPASNPPESLDGITVEQFRDGESAGSGQTGEEILDDPYLSLARLVRQLSRYGFAVEAGQRVITGSILPGMATDGFRAFTANFAGIGSVAVELD